MRFGLTEIEYSFLDNRLISPLKKLGARVFIFGSRARDTHQKFSDIDLLYVESYPIKNSQIYELISFIEESSFPYKIDLVNERELASSYRENVERDKIEI